MIAFKEGEYVIATKPTITEGSGFGMFGAGRQVDMAYMHKPIKVVGVFEAHIVFESANLLDDNVTRHVIPAYELETRGFIVANKRLVELLQENKGKK